MPHLLNMRRALSLATAMTAVACLTSSAALASLPGSTLYPQHKTSDTVSLSSTRVFVETFYTIESCVLNGGSFQIPEKGSKSGPTTANFITQPSFTSCESVGRGIVPQVITRGTWKLSVQYGVPGVTITVPANGLEAIDSGKTVFYVNEKPVEFFGGWTNGFTSPFSQSSVMTWGGRVNSPRNYTLKISPNALLTMTDTSIPADLVVLGPGALG
jgi:hypothetical protein